MSWNKYHQKSILGANKNTSTHFSVNQHTHGQSAEDFHCQILAVVLVLGELTPLIYCGCASPFVIISMIDLFLLDISIYKYYMELPSLNTHYTNWILSAEFNFFAWIRLYLLKTKKTDRFPPKIWQASTACLFGHHHSYASKSWGKS